MNQGLATLAFFGVNVNLVLFLTRVLGQSNGDAANNVSKWTGTVYMFSLIGAFLSDSYWGRYKTCAIFQAIFVLVSRTRLHLYIYIIYIFMRPLYSFIDLPNLPIFVCQKEFSIDLPPIYRSACVGKSFHVASDDVRLHIPYRRSPVSTFVRAYLSFCCRNHWFL